MGDCRESIEFSSQITYIGAHCFENCGLADVIFDKEEDPAGVLTVGDGAFAGNTELWGIYFHDREADLGKDVFSLCAEKVYLCYRKGAEGRASYFKGYADGGHVNAVEIPAYYSETPLVDYPETPYVLKPDVRNFFYGENGESVDEGRFCTSEYDDKAPDYGFPEWHAPCGEFCAMADGVYDISASSELASLDGRYAPKYLNNIVNGWKSS